MKNYTITVNGNVYEVTVEEGRGVAPAVTPISANVIATAPVVTPAPAPVQATQPVETAPAQKAVVPVSSQGNIKINAPMPGKILAIKINQGQVVKRGDVVVILEAMKMENEIVAPSDGIVAGINVAVGASVESGEVLATLN